MTMKGYDGLAGTVVNIRYALFCTVATVAYTIEHFSAFNRYTVVCVACGGKPDEDRFQITFNKY